MRNGFAVFINNKISEVVEKYDIVKTSKVLKERGICVHLPFYLFIKHLFNKYLSKSYYRPQTVKLLH